ncbi:MAG: tetrahydrofolate dehydrogenase/cyclohydrolase catalytic domain-containing protein [Gemmatimonadales bacterium]|jgi:methylenetetrahydrofolate dehydrogenase (NADP+) / methenyltetrahydrofolate cyclohydrolase
MSPAQYQVPGRQILTEVIEAYQPYQPAITALQARVVVVRFEPSSDADHQWTARMDASRISAEQKTRTFNRLGAHVDNLIVSDRVSYPAMRDQLAAANADPAVAAVIVQAPPPAHLQDLVLDELAPEKDIDALTARSQRPACATADGITRVAAPFLDDGATVAVVGARGFVGSGVVTLLQRAGHTPLELDLGDDLRQVRDVDVVISTTGRAGLLTAEHLHAGHRLVVDSGFVPHPSGPIGDVHPGAAGLPQTITPVPGGIGPVEMAILAERLTTQLVAPDLASWRYLGRPAHDIGVERGCTTARHVVAQERSASRERQHAQERGPELDDGLGSDQTP